MNSKDEILLARRAYTKSHSPGMWGPSVAGTVAANESYLDNITREATEELGVHGVDFIVGYKVKHDGKHRYFVQCFFCKVDQPADQFKIQVEEVAEVKWFSKAAIRSALKKNPEEFLSAVSELLENIK